MGGGGDSGPQTTTSVNKVELPKWVEDASQENYKYAKQVAARKDPLYQGERVADFSDATKGAWDWFNQTGQTAGDAQRGASIGVANDLSQFQPDRVNAAQVRPVTTGGQNLDPYLNPWIDNVETRTLDSMDRSRQSALQQNASKAAAAKSFGGSRSAIVDALTNSESMRAAGDMSAQLRKAGWDSAQGLLGADVDRVNAGDTWNAAARNSVAQGNQQAGIAGAGVRANAGDALRGLATDQEAAGFRDYAVKQGIGGQQDQRAQALADEQFNNWQYKDQEGLRDLNIRLSALGMSPYGRTETNTTTAPPQKQPGTDWASVGLGGLQALTSLFAFSDDNAKVDKQKIGELDNGLGIHAFRYKGDPKSYPKTVGVMASEVEKKFPSAVAQVPNGSKVKKMSYPNSKGKPMKRPKKPMRVVNYNAIGW